MPIEIRELVIKTTVDNSAPPSGQLNSQELENLKRKLSRQILGECKTMIDQKIRNQKER